MLDAQADTPRLLVTGIDAKDDDYCFGNELVGRIEIGGISFALRCHHQAEWPANPTPEKCLDYLGTASLDARFSGINVSDD